MHSSYCPEWEYANHPQREQILLRRVSEVLVELAHGTLDTLQTAVDTRSIHQRLFRELTPATYEYYAGHYRGEPLRCLQYYEVEVSNDPRVGYPPQYVLAYMSDLSRIIRDTISRFDAAYTQPHTQLSAGDKLLYLVTADYEIFEFFSSYESVC
jgi:hypothetical protein